MLDFSQSGKLLPKFLRSRNRAGRALRALRSRSISRPEKFELSTGGSTFLGLERSNFVLSTLKTADNEDAPPPPPDQSGHRWKRPNLHLGKSCWAHVGHDLLGLSLPHPPPPSSLLIHPCLGQATSKYDLPPVSHEITNDQQ